ncbi:MAG: bifunctional phosphopantothenoylcysteine decarboxylase/phosphopantothenate--cysteine ligase CoaBC, partial [Candidatus Bipolaricaulia bacterium]
TDLWSEPLAHVELARGADLFLIIPATFNVVGKIAHGIADDLLTTTIAATRAPVLFCPAMDSQMFENPIFQENLRRLEGLGYHFLKPEEGRLASGRTGIGRLPAEERILQAVEEILAEGGLLQGLQILVTAGPTRERFDPMRCITNRSSGRMGYALAQAALSMGAEVTLISGPTQLEPPAGLEFIKVESAAEMHEAALEHYTNKDLILMVAAVADWRPRASAAGKLAKAGRGRLSLELERTPDILKELGERRSEGQVLVGFAAETEDLVENARKKIEEKNLDLVIANDVSRADIGPEAEDNMVTLIWRDGRIEELPKMEKGALAREILKSIRKERG